MKPDTLRGTPSSRVQRLDDVRAVRAARATRSGTYRPKVLVCEDDGATLLSLKFIFKELGCDVTTAALGSAAFHELQSRSFDLVVMDFWLPLLNAERAMHELIGWERIATPFVLISAEDHKEEARELGFMAFYQKPISVDVARKILERFVWGEAPGELRISL